MAINDVAGGRVNHVCDILRECMGHKFVSGIRPLKHEKKRKPKNFFKK